MDVDAVAGFNGLPDLWHDCSKFVVGLTHFGCVIESVQRAFASENCNVLSAEIKELGQTYGLKME